MRCAPHTPCKTPCAMCMPCLLCGLDASHGQLAGCPDAKGHSQVLPVFTVPNASFVCLQCRMLPLPHVFPSPCICRVGVGVGGGCCRWVWWVLPLLLMRLALLVMHKKQTDMALHTDMDMALHTDMRCILTCRCLLTSRSKLTCGCMQQTQARTATSVSRRVWSR